MSKQPKTVPYRQIVARRDTEEGWIDAVQMMADKSLPAVGEHVFIPNLADPDKPWKIIWRAAQVSMQAA